MTKTKAKKKHLGHKDPYKQIENQLKKIKDKINNPPQDEDIQEIPKRLKELMKWKNNPQTNIKKEKRRKRSDLFDTAEFTTKIDPDEYCPKEDLCRPYRCIPTVKQRRGESFRCYERRVSIVTRNVLEESKFEDTHKLEIKTNKRGQMTELVPFKHIDELMSAEDIALKEKQLKKKKLKQEARKKEVEYYRSLRNEKQKFEQREKNFHKKDVKKFGEVVHGPPEVKALPSSKEKPYALKNKQLEKERLRAIAIYRLQSQIKNTGKKQKIKGIY